MHATAIPRERPDRPRPDHQDIARLLTKDPNRARVAVSETLAALTSILLALPIALLGASGWVRTAGIVYASVWGLLVLLSTGTYLAMIQDSVLLFLGKRPILLPLVFDALVSGDIHRRMRVHAWYHFLGIISLFANPLGNVAGALFFQACRWRRLAIADLVAESKERNSHLEYVQWKPDVDPRSEIVGPLLRRAAPDLIHC